MDKDGEERKDGEKVGTRKEKWSERSWEEDGHRGTRIVGVFVKGYARDKHEQERR